MHVIMRLLKELTEGKEKHRNKETIEGKGIQVNEGKEYQNSINETKEDSTESSKDRSTKVPTSLSVEQLSGDIHNLNDKPITDHTKKEN